MNYFRTFLLKHFEVEAMSIAMPWGKCDNPYGIVRVTSHRDGVSATMPTDKLWEAYLKDTVRSEVS